MGNLLCHNANKNTPEQIRDKQIERRLKQERNLDKRVFITGDHKAVADIFSAIDGNESIYQIQYKIKYLICGYIRKQQKTINIANYYLFIPSDLKLLLTKFYGNYQFPKHYEFYPKIQYKNTKYSATNPILPISPISIHNAASPSTSPSSSLLITYHTLSCFRKKDYFSKWIHLLDNSLSIVFVSDLSKINTLSSDMEKFKRLIFYLNGKYNSKMPILLLSGIQQFYQKLSKTKYKQIFQKQFNQFIFNDDDYNIEALQYIKDEYQFIFNNNLKNGINHWTKSKKISHNLYQCTINNVKDKNEVQNVWIKLNKALIHGNIMHELRSGGIAK